MSLRVILISIVCVSCVSAADFDESAFVPADSSSLLSDWHFAGSIYAPMMGVDGDVGVGLLRAPVDIKFKDILGEMDGGFVMAFEARRNRWSIDADFIWLQLSSAATLKANTQIDYSQDQILSSLTVGYEIYRDEKTTVGFLVGGALTSIDADLKIKTFFTTTSASDRRTWIDPFVGLRCRHILTDHWSVFGRFDYGGFGVSSDQYWQGIVGVNYKVSDSTSIALAYRTIAVDYDRGGFTYDTKTSGPNLGIVYRF